MSTSPYVEDGRVQRSRIAADIRKRHLTGKALELVISDPAVQAAFRTSSCPERPTVEWDDRYLEQLTLAAVAEYFDADYLRYLDRVASYVDGQRTAAEADRRGKRRATLFWLVAVALVAAALVVAAIWTFETWAEE